MSRPADLSQAAKLHADGRLDDAIARYQAILAAEPTHPTLRFHLALALIAKRRPDEAATVLAPTDAVSPAAADIYFHLATLFQWALRPLQAAEWFGRALIARPGFVAALFNLGLALQNQGRLAEAADHYRQALARQPDLAEARHNLALMLQMLGRHGEAVDLYRDGLAIQPHATEFARYAVTAAFYDPARTDADRFALAQEFGRRLDRSTDKWRALAVPADPQRRLRIGYLTSDFRDHPIARNVEPLLAHRDRGRFEAIAYADIQTPDATSERLRGVVDLWRPIQGLSDDNVADQIEADGIDILVCLAGHFDRNRPLIAASRPAPVQISFHDVTTSGSRCFDYLIADRVVCPVNRTEGFDERVVRLPSIYVHAPPDDIPLPVAPRPAGPITFGCLNNPAKLNNELLAVWARIVAAVPGSRLLLKYSRWFHAPDLQARIATLFAAFGVPVSRLEFVGGQDSRADHLAHYGRIDIVLDPYPFGGSTATFEALWMGVPVVTLAGTTMMSRWSASMLKTIGLDGLVAATDSEYAAIAIELAQNNDLRRVLREDLRERVRRSPLCNGRLRARQIERVYRALWRRWCAGAAA